MSKTTTTGRVVYSRKKHLWRIRDVTTICEKIGNDYDHAELAKQAIAINTLYKVVEGGLLPFYLYALKPKNITVGDVLGEELRAYVKSKFRETAKTLSVEIAREIGIPNQIINFVMKVLFDPIWRAVDYICDVVMGKHEFSDEDYPNTET